MEIDTQNDRGNTALHYCYAYNFIQLAGEREVAGERDRRKTFRDRRKTFRVGEKLSGLVSSSFQGGEEFSPLVRSFQGMLDG